jgi:hypothetical protein
VERRLGALEHAFWVARRLRPFNVVAVAHVRGPLMVEQLVIALGQLQRRHPALGVRIVRLGWPSFTSEGVGPIPIRFVARQGDDDWRRELEREVDEPFAIGPTPMVRATLIHGADSVDILLAYDHVIGDAESGIIAMTDLLHTIGHPSEESPVVLGHPPLEAIEPPVPWSLAAGVDGVTTMTPKGIVVAAARLARNLPLLRRGLCRMNAEQPQTGPSSMFVHSRIEPALLPKEITRRLTLAACAQGTTAEAALTAAYLLATAAGLPSLTKDRLRCAPAFDVRPYLTRDVARTFSCLIAVGAASYAIQPTTSFWELAREVKVRTAQVKADQSRLFAFARFFGAFGRLRSPFLFYSLCWLGSGWPDVGAASVLNLGARDLPERWEELELIALRIATSPYWHFALSLIAVTVNGQLSWSFEYLEPFLSTDEARNINADIERHLREAALIVSSERATEEGASGGSALPNHSSPERPAAS